LTVLSPQFLFVNSLLRDHWVPLLPAPPVSTQRSLPPGCQGIHNSQQVPSIHQQWPLFYRQLKQRAKKWRV